MLRDETPQARRAPGWSAANRRWRAIRRPAPDRRPFSGGHAADRLGGLLGWRVLDDESPRACHREPVDAGHLDVEQRVPPKPPPGSPPGAPARRRRRCGSAPGRRRATDGSSRVGVCSGDGDSQAPPVGCRGPASTTPPSAATRSRRPVRPFPGDPSPPTPSSSISTEEVVRRRTQQLACAWRTRLVRPSRTTHPNTSWWEESTTSTALGSSAVIPAARSSSRPVASSPASVTSR
jgi:hypothetical protein